MVTVSSSFLAALRSGAEQNIRLEFASGEVIDKAQISANGGFRYQQILNQDGDLKMGTAIMSNIEVSLLNTDGYFDGFDFTEECTAKYGVMVGSEYEYVTLGVFKGDRVNRVKSRVFRYSANDRMMLFEKDASAFIEGLVYPLSVYQMFQQLCEFVGVTWESAASMTANARKIIEANPFDTSAYTCREVLAWIAEVMCSYAVMNRDGAVKLVWFAESSYSVPKSDRFELSQSEIRTPAIDRLEVYTSYSDMLNTSGTGDNLYTISDNPLLYAENDDGTAALQDYADNIYASLSAFPAYYPSAFRAISNPAVECGDIITVTADDGTKLVFPVFMQTIQWSGRGKTEYENTGNPKRENTPIAQRELENLKKKMLKTTDLTTAIDSYLKTDEGKAGILSAVEGEYVTSDDLEKYALKTAVQQEIDGVNAKISLTAEYGSGTIGSNVRAMLTLFANADSSKIKLKANAIDLTGYVTFNALTTEGATTINGANVTTDNLYISKIYGDKGTLLEDIIVMATSGNNIALGNPSSTGCSTNITVWANNISFKARSAASTSDYLVISAVDSTASIDGVSYKYPLCIYPYSASGGNWSWDIGNSDYAFSAIYLDAGVYLYDSSNDAWTRLYVSSGNLYWRDWDGVRNKLATGS